MDLLFDGFSPTGLFGDGMNLYQYLGSNPISGLDPSGLYFGLLGGGGAAALDAGAAQSAAGAAVAGGLLLAMILIQQQGLDLILDGVAATQSGSFALGESLMTSGEGIIATLSGALVGGSAILRAEFEGKTVAVIIKLYKKAGIQNTGLPPGGPGWDEILRMLWEDIVAEAKKHKKWAQTVKKLLTDKRFDKP
jgi:hypothetical protein